MVSQDRDLRAGTTVWEAYSHKRIPILRLSKNISTDILIIGAGISGAMAAEALSGHGMSIAIIDKRKPLSGSTSASTALLQYEIDTPLIHLIDKIGRKDAVAAWRRSKLGLESLYGKVRELGIECDMQLKNTLYLSGNILNPRKLEMEHRERLLAGLSGKMLGKKDLKEDFGIRGDAALMSWNNLTCNPVQLAGGFLQTALEHDATLYSSVTALDLAHDRNQIIVTTEGGHTIKARYVVFTTGYEIPKYIKTRKHKVHSTWAIATKPVRGLPDDMPMIWEAAEPYCYARTTPDKRMIFGGDDEEFIDEETRNALLPAKQRALEKKLRKLLPDLDFETDYAWTGSFGGSTNGLPSIGRIPGHKNCYAVMAYGGNGITFSRIAAEIIAADILGARDPDAKLFSFK